MLAQAWTGMNSTAPALALLTAGVSGAELRAQVSTPAAPRKYAARTAAPMFCCAAAPRHHTSVEVYVVWHIMYPSQ